MEYVEKRGRVARRRWKKGVLKGLGNFWPDFFAVLCYLAGHEADGLLLDIDLFDELFSAQEYRRNISVIDASAAQCNVLQGKLIFVD